MNVRGTVSFNLEHINDNSINNIYLDKSDISLKIDKNKDDISSDLGIINTNKNDIKNNDADIAYNVRQINIFKNNISKLYLKNVYDILFCDKKIQIDLKNLFYEKLFEVNAKQNDFISIYFKINLQYEDISDLNYIKIVFEIFDDNNKLYIKSVNNNKYLYFKSHLIIDENVFYDFTNNVEKIKIIIKFQRLSPNDIKIWYIKNDNNRLILKYFGN